MVWDLHPTVDMSSNNASVQPSPDLAVSPSPGARPQPTAYVIAFPHPLTSVNSHPATSKEFLVSDCRGSIFLTDWRSDPEAVSRQENRRNSNLVELIDPKALSDTSLGIAERWSGSVAWRRDTSDMQVLQLYQPIIVETLFLELVLRMAPHFQYGTFPSCQAEYPRNLELVSKKEVIDSGTLPFSPPV